MEPWSREHCFFSRSSGFSRIQPQSYRQALQQITLFYWGISLNAKSQFYLKNKNKKWNKGTQTKKTVIYWNEESAHSWDIPFLTKSAKTERPSCVWFHAWLSIPSVINADTEKEKGKKNAREVMKKGTMLCVGWNQTLTNATFKNPNQGLFTEHSPRKEKEQEQCGEIRSSEG